MCLWEINLAKLPAEYWSDGVLEQWGKRKFQHSNTPTFHYSNDNESRKQSISKYRFKEFQMLREDVHAF